MDELLQFILLDGQARALVAWTPGVLQDMQQVQGTTPVTTAALGRVLTASCLLAADLKAEEHRLSIQIKGGGIAGDAFALARPDGQVKGYIQYPLVELPFMDNGAQDVGWALGGQGRMTVIRDLGGHEPYVGQVELQSGEVADDVAYYLLKSEQTPSMVALGEWIDKSGIRAAGGLMLQTLPGCSEEALAALEAMAQVYTPFSGHLKKAANATELAQPLEELGAQRVFSKPLQFKCDCSRERLEQVLLSMGKAEIESMIADQGGAQLTCHFCNSVYDFSADELRGLLRAGQ